MNYKWDKTYTASSGREFFDFGYRHDQKVRVRWGKKMGIGTVTGIPPVFVSYTEEYMRRCPNPTIGVRVEWEDGRLSLFEFDPVTKIKDGSDPDSDCSPRLLD